MPGVRRFVILLLTGWLIIVPGVAHSAGMVRIEESRYAMGCLYSIVAWGPERARLRRAAQSALDEVDRLDRLLSNYKAESELSRINREAWPGPVTTDAETFGFLETAFEFSRRSGGAFDMTVGPLMRAWGFFSGRVAGEGRMPAEGVLREARERVGYGHVRLDPARREVSFDRAGIELDPGGIGKGYAVDRAAAVLRAAGVRSALISAGGSSVYAIGTPPGARAWPVSIQDPLDARRTALTVRLRDNALSVSGSAEKFFEVDGVRYAHIMDPRTGWPVQGVLSVAVISERGIDGDALDNVFFVLGPDRSREVWKDYPVSRVMIFATAPGGRWRLVSLGGTR